ncbi:hypothetical protein D0Z07_0924 [Hyphodiscus hymeniophilus]|uniref:SprT-like domain-containing protein n=1 Tax=Hyphodiscus hymeniophilus TaxID=353542 RepID=A0A9P7B0A7_9HELO|nr:hypothetical protein D0Z07_0924 [Hyphodiscus hymeniophilus]
MAATLRAGSSPDSKLSRHRHAGHDRTPMEGNRRRDSYSRRPRSREQSARRSPQRQLHKWASQFPSSVTSPNTSTPSLLLVDPPRSFTMERTPSGNSIISDDTYESLHNNTLRPCSDDEAASRVKYHIRRHPPHGKHERILRRLIEGNGPIDRSDVEALDSALTAADVLFFDSQLKGRVRWDWSHPDEPRYENELIGTTAIRDAQQGGFETLIVLSDPILNNPDYDRQLLLSAFLHELIHCYLFILCGFDARVKGGHTKGFHDIAEIIDTWVGSGYLRLCNMKANLNHFRNNAHLRTTDPGLEMPARHTKHAHDGCNQSPRPHGEQHFPEAFPMASAGMYDPRVSRHSHEGCNQSPAPYRNQLEEMGVLRPVEKGSYF